MDRKDKIELSWYLALCFVASFVVDSFIRDHYDTAPFYNVVILALPGLTALALYQFRSDKIALVDGGLGLKLDGLKYWLWAPVSISLLCFLSYGVSVVLHPELLKSREEIITALIESGMYFGSVGLSAAAIILINAFLGSLANIPIYLGQELGWRAFMQPSLLKSLHPIFAFLIGGVTWGLWSFFFVESKSLATSFPGFFILMMFCIPVGVILYYFYFKSKSIFVAAFAHASLYQSIESGSTFLKVNEINQHWTGPISIVGIILFWLVAILLLKMTNWQTHTS